MAASKAEITRVLLVEDDEHARPALQEALERASMACITATSLEQARELVLTAEFDVLVADLQLPDGRGTDLVADLRQDRPNLPVVIITGYPGEASRHEEQPREIWLLKPFLTAALTDAINRVLAPSP